MQTNSEEFLFMKPSPKAKFATIEHDLKGPSLARFESLYELNSHKQEKLDELERKLRIE
jgi:hypothetical protein